MENPLPRPGAPLYKEHTQWSGTVVNTNLGDEEAPERLGFGGDRSGRLRQKGSLSGRMRGAAWGGIRHAKRLVVLVVGLTVLAVGTAMIVLPGPAVVVIPVGLGILATEFVWAQRLLHKLKERAQQLVSRGQRANGSREPNDRA